MRLIADNYPPWRLLYDMNPSVTKVWSVAARSVGDAYRDALSAFPRCLPKETWRQRWYASFRNKSMISYCSVSWRRVQRRFVGISSLASKGDVTGSGETESGADKIPAMNASLGLSGFLPPTLSPALRLPFPNMANECLPSRTPLAFIPRGAGDFFNLFLFSLKFLK